MAKHGRGQNRKSMQDGVGSLREFLTFLREDFPCRSIMTPWSQILSVAGHKNDNAVKDAAGVLMDKHNFSCVPLVDGGKLLGLYRRAKPTAQICYISIREDHFFPGDGDIITLLQQMRDRKRFAMILGDANHPDGLVTYADFSKRPARVIIFAVVAEVEYLLARAIDEAFPADGWIEVLEAANDDPDHTADELRERQSRASDYETTMPLSTFATIGHLISVVRHSPRVRELLGETDAVADQLRSLPDLRNRVAHVVKPVIAGPLKIKIVAREVELMFEWIDRWEARWTRG